jgi:hypothetical protein
MRFLRGPFDARCFTLARMVVPSWFMVAIARSEP